MTARRNVASCQIHEPEQNMAYKSFKTEFKCTEETRAARRAYYEKLKADPERLAALKAKRRAYYLANKERIKKQVGGWLRAHPERKKEYTRTSYHKNKAKLRDKSRAYYAANRERLIAATKTWLSKMTPEERRLFQREIYRRWYAKNRVAFNERRRLARAQARAEQANKLDAVSPQALQHAG